MFYHFKKIIIIVKNSNLTQSPQFASIRQQWYLETVLVHAPSNYSLMNNHKMMELWEKPVLRGEHIVKIILNTLPTKHSVANSQSYKSYGA